MDCSPASLLGQEHPLVLALERYRAAVARSLAVGAVLAGALLALASGEDAALVVVLAAAVVELGLVLGVAVRAGTKRELVLELISEGHADVPIAEVEHARAQLARPEAHEKLAHDLDDLREQATAWRPTLPMPRVTFHPRVIRAVAPELERLAADVRSADAALPGLAQLERSLRDGTSPLYGASAEALRQHLRQIRFLLA
jgi:hypothetical protein